MLSEGWVTTETHAVTVLVIRRRIPETQRLIGILTCGNTINIFTGSGVSIIRPGLQSSVSPHLYRCFTNRFPNNWVARLMKRVGILAIDSDPPFKP